MKYKIWLCTALWPAAVLGAAAPSSCPQPQMQVEQLIVANDGRDRGYPGGLSLGDVDDDGDIDLLATRGYDPTAKPYRGDRSLLYLNGGSGAFVRSESPFADEEAPDSGATLADVDADGDLDAYISTQLKKPNRFFRNEGGGRFVAAQLGDATQDASSNFSSSFVDIDLDGDLDLYVTGPTLELNDVNLAFRNDVGHFVAVTGIAIDNGKNNPAASLWADFDNDGDPDLFVANSDVLRLSKYPPAGVEHGVLYRNDRNWSFTVLEGQAFANPAHPAISAAAGDVDNDGDLDLFVGSHVYNVDPRPDWLFLNDGHGRFTLAAQAFPTHKETATGAAFADFNGDGNLDLLAISYEGPIELFTGDGTGAFEPVDDPALREARKGRWSAVTGDIDNDGRIDALLGSWGETAEGDYITILRNRTPRCGSWTEIVVPDAAGALNPPGTRVTFTTVEGRKKLSQTREASAQSGFRSQSSNAFLFAIPPGHRVREVVVRWRDGRVKRTKKIERNGKTVVGGPRASLLPGGIQRRGRIFRGTCSVPRAAALKDELKRVVPFVAGILEDQVVAAQVVSLARPRLRVVQRIRDREHVVELFIRHSREALDDHRIRRDQEVRHAVLVGHEVTRFDDERVAFPPGDRISQPRLDHSGGMLPVQTKDARLMQRLREEHDRSTRLDDLMHVREADRQHRRMRRHRADAAFPERTLLRPIHSFAIDNAQSLDLFA